MNLFKLLSITLLFYSAIVYARELPEFNDINEVIRNVGKPLYPTCPTSEAELINEEQLWEAKGYFNTNISYLSVEDYYPEHSGVYTHKLDLTLVNLRGSGFNKSLIEDRIKRVAKIYRQCGIKITEAKIVESDPPDGNLDISYKNKDDTKLARKAPEKRRPILFLVRSNIEGHSGYAWNRSHNFGPPREDISVVTSNILSKSHTTSTNQEYSTIAHEIGHILCSCGHIDGDENNLMSNSYNNLSGDINKDQCDVFRESPLVRKIE